MRIPFLELGGTPEGILTLRMLKAQPLGQLFTDVIWDEKLLFSISDSVFERMMRYVLSQEGTPEQLRARIAHFHNKPLKDKTMTIAEQLKQEGRREGRQDGREEGLRLAILRALEIHFGPVPQKIPDALEGITDLSRLEKLLESALRSNSVEEFSESI